MKRTVFLLLSFVFVTLSASSAAPLKGDVNGDGAVDVADIATVIDIMAGKGGDTPEMQYYTTCPDANHPHLIDLGLPSGTMWACCNVGAGTPEESGDFFAWGETKPKDVYSLTNYTYFNFDTGYDFIGYDIAGTVYDAATANWSIFWQMPSTAQCMELAEECVSVWTTQNGINGRLFTGQNGGTLFLPAAGGVEGDGVVFNAGKYGYYWSSSFNSSGTAFDLYIRSDGIYSWNVNRDEGKTVRPVHQN